MQFRRQLIGEIRNAYVDSGSIVANVPTGQYSLLQGVASIVGSMTIRFRTAAQSGGPFLVSSNWACNSGPNIMSNAPNYGIFHSIDVTASTSQTATIQIVGDIAR